MERHSGEVGAPSVLNPLALTYHFGRATSMPDGSRTSEITGRRLQPAVDNNVEDRDGADNSILNASFRDGQGVHSMKRDGTDRTISEASGTQSLGEVRGVYSKKKLKLAHSGRRTGIIFSDKIKTLLVGSIQRK